MTSHCASRKCRGACQTSEKLHGLKLRASERVWLEICHIPVRDARQCCGRRKSDVRVLLPRRSRLAIVNHESSAYSVVSCGGWWKLFDRLRRLSATLNLLACFRVFQQSLPNPEGALPMSSSYLDDALPKAYHDIGFNSCACRRDIWTVSRISAAYGPRFGEFTRNDKSIFSLA